MVPLEIPIELSRTEAERLALEELSTWRYGLNLPPWLLAFQERVERLLNAMLESLLGLNEPTGGGGRGSWFAIVLVLLVLLAAVLVVRRVGLPRWNRRRTSGLIEADATVSAEQYRSLAEAAAGRGEWRTAVRERFRSLVRALETRTILDPRPSRTALEVGTLAGRLMPDHQDELFAAAAIFNDVEYGDAVATPEHYAQLSALESVIVAGANKVDLAAAEARLG